MNADTDYVPWHVYLVECNDGSLYCGTTNNLERRVREHNIGKRGSKYCRAHRPVKLIWSMICGSRSSACKMETVIKKLGRREKARLMEK